MHTFYQRTPHSVFFQATVDVWSQLVQRESVAEPQARGDSAASVVNTVSVGGPQRGDLASECTSKAGGQGCAESDSVVQGSGAKCGVNKRHEGGVHISGPSEGAARQEASRVHVWWWKRAAPILVVLDAPSGGWEDRVVWYVRRSG